MARNAHLTLEERLTIESGLRENLNFREIALKIGKDPSTVSKEIRAHIIKEETPAFNPCTKRKTCKHYGDVCKECTSKRFISCKKCERHCYLLCSDFEELTCAKLSKPPYVCNGCADRRKCKLRRHLYDAKTAQAEYEKVRSESRQGISVDAEELRRIDDIVSPLVKQGQSIHHICANNADVIMLDQRTIYNYVDAGLLSVGNLDLPRKVRYRPRHKKKDTKVDKQCYVGRTYEDYKEYIRVNHDVAVVEMDSVEGRKGGKLLLTLYFCESSLMIAFLRDRNTARSITDIFNGLYETLGHDVFVDLFPVILTDRGTEFSDPKSIEFNANNERRTRIFYCDPQCPHEKGGCEVTHELIRKVLPKGTSFDHLTQQDVSLMMSHINSYTRKKLNNRSAHQLFSFLHGQDVLVKLGVREIPANEVNLTPRLINK